MNASLARVPCTIVTGFLGAGKTTLIRHLIAHAQGRRLAVIVNEFGDVGIDGEILRSCGIESCPEENIVELANGCLCCTVADDFVKNQIKGQLTETAEFDMGHLHCCSDSLLHCFICITAARSRSATRASISSISMALDESSS